MWRNIYLLFLSSAFMRYLLCNKLSRIGRRILKVPRGELKLRRVAKYFRELPAAGTSLRERFLALCSLIVINSNCFGRVLANY